MERALHITSIKTKNNYPDAAICSASFFENSPEAVCAAVQFPIRSLFSIPTCADVQLLRRAVFVRCMRGASDQRHFQQPQPRSVACLRTTASFNCQRIRLVIKKRKILVGECFWSVLSSQIASVFTLWYRHGLELVFLVDWLMKKGRVFSMVFVSMLTRTILRSRTMASHFSSDCGDA